MADESISSVDSLPIEATVATGFNRYGSPIAPHRESAARRVEGEPPAAPEQEGSNQDTDASSAQRVVYVSIKMVNLKELGAFLIHETFFVLEL